MIAEDVITYSESRRGVRVAEGARLESVFTRNRNVGSNPTLSAKYPFQNQLHRDHIFRLYGNCTVQEGIALPRLPDVSFHLLLPLSHPRRVVALGDLYARVPKKDRDSLQRNPGQE
jgi:hypothetical protein